MKLKEHIEKVKDGSIDIVSYTKEVLEECKKIDDEYHYFAQITSDQALTQAERVKRNPQGRLAGAFISLKDCICMKGVHTQSSSRILKGYEPVFDATVVRKLLDEGAIIIGKTIQDEFGFGGFSTNVGLGFKVPLNPFDKERSTGGSSGGSGGLVQKATFPHVSLGESTGGSIVSPSSLCGVYGLCPTYGRVSRYGLLDYGNSLDKIGPMGKHLEDLSLVMGVIAGHDENESTSLDEPVPNYSASLSRAFKGRIAIIKESLVDGVSDVVQNKFREIVSNLKKKGFDVDEISLPTPYTLGIPTYYIIAQSESSTNLAKYCGLRYGVSEDLTGSFNEYFSKVRANHFGKEAKRRVIIGTFARMVGFRDAYYIRAMKVRTKIINEYKEAFRKYDILLTPTVPYLAPRFDEISKMSLLETYMADVLCVGSNLAGLPHMNVPVGFTDGLAQGVTLISDHLNEEKLLQGGVILQ